MTTPSNRAEAVPERRSSPRIPIEMWVEESTDRELYFQRGANISAGGLFLERTIPHALGTIVTLGFCLSGDPVPFRVKGEIVNVGDSADDLGMGVKFIELDESERQRIASFIDRASSSSEPL